MATLKVVWGFIKYIIIIIIITSLIDVVNSNTSITLVIDTLIARWSQILIFINKKLAKRNMEKTWEGTFNIQ